MIRLTVFLIAAAGPAMAAGDAFFSLANTDFVVLVAFLVFLGIIVWARVPGRLVGMLDKRADGIRSELDEARALREEAQTLLASYERRQGEVQAQADRIVKQARDEATAAAERAKEDLRATIDRRMQGAQDQIETARAAAIREVRDEAARIAVAAAADVFRRQMDEGEAARLIDSSIDTVSTRLN